MTIERYLRLIAGFLVMLSAALGYWVHPGWFLFTAFVGLNLFQSAFTNWCPMMTILRKLGLGATGISNSAALDTAAVWGPDLNVQIMQRRVSTQ
jgi:hypothetical protein